MRAGFRLATVFSLAGAIALANTACLAVDRSDPRPKPPRAAGPPPHAPAHGYRYKYQDHDLVFDDDLGVYVVLSLSDVWFLEGRYFRISGDHWEIGVNVDGPWRFAEERAVPSRLAKKRHPHGGPPGQKKKKKESRGKPHD